MSRRAVPLALILLSVSALSSDPAPAAEIFYMDRDAFSNEYVGPVGPLVLSGEIAPGDYAHLLAKIAEDQNRFLSRNKLILASAQGNAEEAMKIARLVKSLYTEVIVGPLTGRCAGACFLIYAAAAQRGTDGENLLGVSRPGLAESEWAAMPTAQAALLEDGMQAPVRTFLSDNEVPPDIVDAMFERPPTDIYWLSEQQESALTPKSPSFAKYLTEKCGWSAGFERAVYQGQRPVDDLQELTACRLRTTQPEARKALALALKDAQPKKAAPAAPAPAAPASSKKSVTRAPRAENKTIPSS
ncbi:MAG: hypothetical protein ABSC32_09655 [Steroidobacteraceae bacterium]|jgi:hypothetical protein